MLYQAEILSSYLVFSRRSAACCDYNQLSRVQHIFFLSSESVSVLALLPLERQGAGTPAKIRPHAM